jgi:hypothetical protein
LTIEISFELPTSLSDAELPSYLMDNSHLYRSSLDLTGDYYDRKSQVERWEIENISINDSQVVIHYRIEYSGFKPCQDLRYTEIAKRQVVGKRAGNVIQFETFEPPERRSTCDEL